MYKEKKNTKILPIGLPKQYVKMLEKINTGESFAETIRSLIKAEYQREREINEPVINF